MKYQGDHNQIATTLLESTLNGSREGICWIQKTGKIAYINHALIERLGLAESELFDLVIQQICPTMTYEGWRNLLGQLYTHQSQLLHLSFRAQTRPTQQLLVKATKVIAHQQIYVSLVVVDQLSIIQHPLIQQLGQLSQIGIWTWQAGQTQLQVNTVFSDLLSAFNFQTLVPLTAVQTVVRQELNQEDRTQAIRQLHLLRTEFSPVELGLTLLATGQRVLINAYAEVSNRRLTGCFGTVLLLNQENNLFLADHFTTKLLQANPQPLLILNSEAAIIMTNQALLDLTQYTLSALKVLPISELLPQFQALFDWKTAPPTATRKAKTNCRTNTNQSLLVELTLKIIPHHGRNFYLISLIETVVNPIQPAIASLPKPVTYNDLNEMPRSQTVVSQNTDYQKVMQQIAQVAYTEATVLILGETGTGKELLARAVHQQSSRNAYPLVKINCAALPENLIESELFGHEKGAFTGAIEQKIGRFELADRGTIFLDEIGELPLDLQPKLLRVLQEGEFERVGSSQTIQVDVRVVAATNRNLVKLINAGKFREDLYYRLNVFPIENIPLRQRKDDIPLLAAHFVKKYSDKIGKTVTGIQTKAMNKLMKYDYPGNIRELENIIERAVILTKGKKLSLDHWLPRASAAKNKEEQLLSFEEAQKQHIIKALKKTKWRVSGQEGAAKLLQMNAKTLESKMRKYGLIRKEYFRQKKK